MIILTDLDHTICDAHWRDHMLPAAHATGLWDDYHKAGDEDEPIAVTVAIMRLFSKTPPWSVIGLTGRDERWRKPTLLWLWRHGVVPTDLLMRPEGDATPTAEMKVNLIRRHITDLSRIAAVFEDREDCVVAFKKIGLNVVQYHDSRRGDVQKIIP